MCQSWGPHLGQANDCNNKAVGLWEPRCQVKELLLYPWDAEPLWVRHAPVKTEDLSDSNGEWVRSSQAWSPTAMVPTLYHRKLLNRESSNCKAGERRWLAEESRKSGDSLVSQGINPEWWRAGFKKWHIISYSASLHVCMRAWGKERADCSQGLAQNKGTPEYNSPTPFYALHCCLQNSRNCGPQPSPFGHLSSSDSKSNIVA